MVDSPTPFRPTMASPGSPTARLTDAAAPSTVSEEALRVYHALRSSPNDEIDIANEDVLHQVLTHYRNEWLPPPTSSYEEAIRYAVRKFTLVDDKGEEHNLEDKLFPTEGLPTLQQSDIEQAYKAELFRWIQLQYFCRAHNLLDTSLAEGTHADLQLQDSSAVSRDIQLKFDEIAQTMLACRSVLHSHLRLWKTINHEIDRGAPTLDPYQYMPYDSNDKLNGLQELVVFTLQQLRAHGYRRFRKAIWEPIYVHNAEGKRISTHAWQVVPHTSDVKAFVYKLIRKEDYFKQWKNLTSSAGNVASLVKHLEECDEMEFAELRPMRSLMSFRNGILRLTDMRFFPFGSRAINSEWVTCKFHNAMFDVERWSNVLGVLVNNDEYIYVKHLPEDRQLIEDTARGEISMEERPMTKRNGERKVYTDEMQMGYCQKVQWEGIHKYLEESGLDTPYLDKIFKKQLWYEDSRGFWRTPIVQEHFATDELKNREYHHILLWEYALLGRLLYPVGQEDNWQVVPYFKGTAGTGKSTIIELAGWFFQERDVGNLGNETRKGVGALESVYDKFIFRVFEVKKNFELSQAVFQSMISGEMVVVDRLFATSLDVVWDVPGILAGNEFFGWKDAAGSLMRRCVVTNFPVGVGEGEKDPDLKKHLRQEVPKILVKCAFIYQMMKNVYSKSDIWSILPRYFHFTRTQLQSATDPFGNFLNMTINQRLKRAPNVCMTLKSLQEMFIQWLEHEDLPKRIGTQMKNNHEQIEAALAVHKLQMQLVTPQNYAKLNAMFKAAEETDSTSKLPDKDKELYVVIGVCKDKNFKDETDAPPPPETTTEPAF